MVEHHPRTITAECVAASLVGACSARMRLESVGAESVVRLCFFFVFFIMRASGDRRRPKCAPTSLPYGFSASLTDSVIGAEAGSATGGAHF